MKSVLPFYIRMSAAVRVVNHTIWVFEKATKALSYKAA